MTRVLACSMRGVLDMRCFMRETTLPDRWSLFHLLGIPEIPYPSKGHRAGGQAVRIPEVSVCWDPEVIPPLSGGCNR